MFCGLHIGYQEWIQSLCDILAGVEKPMTVTLVVAGNPQLDHSHHSPLMAQDISEAKSEFPVGGLLFWVWNILAVEGLGA